jgi:hypothetical protein
METWQVQETKRAKQPRVFFPLCTPLESRHWLSNAWSSPSCPGFSHSFLAWTPSDLFHVCASFSPHESLIP